MKKVLIVTMHRGDNYGSALQVYALSECLKNIGRGGVLPGSSRLHSGKSLIGEAAAGRVKTDIFVKVCKRFKSCCQRSTHHIVQLAVLQ